MSTKERRESGLLPRIGRRRVLGTAALAGGGAAFALACGGGSKSRTDTSTGTSTEGRLQAIATG